MILAAILSAAVTVTAAVPAPEVTASMDPTGVMGWLGFSPKDWTLSAVVFLFVMMVMTGFLKPWNQVRDIIRDIRTDRDDWKALAQQSQNNFTTLANATKESTESSKTVAKFVTAAQDELGVDER